MLDDPIVAEIRKQREAHAASHRFDSQSIFADLMQKEEVARQQGGVFVSLPPKPVQQPKLAA